MGSRKQSETEKFQHDPDVSNTTTWMRDLAIAAQRRVAGRDPSQTMAVLATILGEDDPQAAGQACDPSIRARLFYSLREEGFLDHEGHISALSTGTAFPMEAPRVQSRTRTLNSHDKPAIRRSLRPEVLAALHSKLEDMVLDEHLDAAAEEQALRTLTERLNVCLASPCTDIAAYTNVLDALLALRHIQASRIATHAWTAQSCADLSADRPADPDPSIDKK